MKKLIFQCSLILMGFTTMAFTCTDRFIDCDQLSPLLVNLDSVTINHAQNGGSFGIGFLNKSVSRKNYMMQLKFTTSFADSTNTIGCDRELVNGIKDIKINTIYNLTPDFPSGADISSLFQTPNQSNQVNKTKFEEVISITGKRFFDLRDLYLTRYDKINPNTVFAAEVLITLSNNVTFKTTTDEIILE